MHWWPSSVCPSVCPINDTKSRTEGCRKLIIGRKEAHDKGNLWPSLEVERSIVFGREEILTMHSLHFTGMLMSNRQLVYNRDANVQQTTSILWVPSWKLWVAVQVTTCRGRGICGSPHYWPHSLLLLHNFFVWHNRHSHM